MLTVSQAHREGWRRGFVAGLLCGLAVVSLALLLHGSG